MTREHREPVGHGSRIEPLDRRARHRERAQYLARARPERQLPGRREQRRTRRCFELAPTRLRQPGEAHVDRVRVAEPEDAGRPVRTAARVSDGLALKDDGLAPTPQRVRGRQPEQSCADDHHVRALDLRHAPTLRRRRENQLMRLELVTLVVRDYDEALAYYTGVLGFVLVEDTRLTETKRWIVVRPPGSSIGLLLAQADSAQERARIGDQTGGRVAFFLYTDDLAADHERLRGGGVHFRGEPRVEPYGTSSCSRIATEMPGI
jgi:catechol 2,3-dioxygenase-like lactoylglutathione lyase family enzyme